MVGEIGAAEAGLPASHVAGWRYTIPPPWAAKVVTLSSVFMSQPSGTQVNQPRASASTVIELRA